MIMKGLSQPNIYCQICLGFHTEQYMSTEAPFVVAAKLNTHKNFGLMFCLISTQSTTMTCLCH